MRAATHLSKYGLWQGSYVQQKKIKQGSWYVAIISG
jgi:hypothetical protein